MKFKHQSMSISVNKPICLKKTKDSIRLKDLFPSTIHRSQLINILKTFKFNFKTYKKEYYLSPVQIHYAYHYLKVYRYLPAGLRNNLSAFISYENIDFLTQTLEKVKPKITNNLASNKECKKYIYKGRVCLCYKYFDHSLKFVLLSKRLIHHIFSVDGVQYLPLDIIKDIRPFKHRISYNVVRYEIARAIASYVDSLETEIIY